jgi:hypothetical protein
LEGSFLMKETWSAMRKIIAPIMFVALATTGMTVAGSTAAHADTANAVPTLINYSDGNALDATDTFDSWNTWSGPVSSVGVDTAPTPNGGNALKFVKGPEGYSGFSVSNNRGLVTDATHPSVTLDVYNAQSSDRNVLVKLQVGGDGDNGVAKFVNAVPGWSTVTADFSTGSMQGGTWTPATKAYNNLVLMPGFGYGSAGQATGGDIFYIDNIIYNDVVKSAAPVSSGTSVACANDAPQSCPSNSALTFANGSNAVVVTGGAFTSTGSSLTVTVTSPVGAADAGKHGTFQWFDASGVTITKETGAWDAGKCLDEGSAIQCQYMLGSDGTATFTLAISGSGTAKFHSVGPVWASDVLTGTFSGGGASASASATPAAAAPVFLNFAANDALASNVNSFGDAFGSVACGQYVFPATGQVWAGLNVFGDNGIARVTDAGHSVVTFDVTNPSSVASNVMVKLEGPGAPTALTYVTVQPGTHNASVDFSTVTGWTSSKVYKKLALFPGFAADAGGTNDTARDGRVYKIDNISVNGGTSSDVSVASSVATISLTAASKTGLAVADCNYTKSIAVGTTTTVTYHVDINGVSAGAGKGVKLNQGNTAIYANNAFARTDASGNATFSLTGISRSAATTTFTPALVDGTLASKIVSLVHATRPHLTQFQLIMNQLRQVVHVQALTLT